MKQRDDSEKPVDTSSGRPFPPFNKVVASTQLHLVRCFRVRFPTEGGHHMFREQMLRFDALPMLEPTKIRNNRQFTNSALLLQSSNLGDHFLRRTNVTDFLLDDLLVCEFC